MSAKPENERERIIRIIEDMVSAPILRDPVLQAAHRHDIESAADAILARQTAQDQGSSSGLGQPGSGSRDEADVVATAALAMEFEQSLRGEANPGDELYGIWEAIGRDARLNAARQKLSAHEITLIVGHARGQLDDEEFRDDALCQAIYEAAGAARKVSREGA